MKNERKYPPPSNLELLEEDFRKARLRKKIWDIVKFTIETIIGCGLFYLIARSCAKDIINL